MSDREMDEITKLLKEALPPVGESPMRRDLWPTMARRLEERSVRVPWWDWALLAGASLLTLLYPGVIPALLYHL
jgi:hypothetical protein